MVLPRSHMLQVYDRSSLLLFRRFFMLMASKFCISLSTQLLKTSPNIPSTKPNSPFPRENQTLATSSRRKLLSTSILNALLVNGTLLQCSLAQEQQDLERYTDADQGFTLLIPTSYVKSDSLLIPTSYVKVDKSDATVLFEKPGTSNNVGVVVSPVRLASLREFGTPQFLADKLLQAERRKESTEEAEVVGAVERVGNGGLQVYEIKYRLDSTRGGLKRVFSAACLILCILMRRALLIGELERVWNEFFTLMLL